MLKLLRAVAHIHNSNVVHRDIKPDNILFVDKTADSDLKIIDLGLANKLMDRHKLVSAVGTPYYVSPDVLRGKYGAECDIWALGVLLFVMLGGNPPFLGETEKEVYSKIIHQELEFDPAIWHDVS